MTGRVTSPVFVGRTTELEALSSAYARAEEGTPSIVVIGGEAGVGKTRLIKEFLAGLDTPRVYVGSCLELGGDDLPYAPFVAVIRGLVRELGAPAVRSILPESGRRLAQWLPELAGDSIAEDSPSGKLRLFEEVLTLLEHAASDRPILIVMEDLHWADGASRELLGFLARNLSGAQVMFVGTYRSTDLEPDHPLRLLFADVCRSEAVDRITVERLSFYEVGRLVAAILDRPAEPTLVKRVYGRSDGNPLFVEALLETGENVPPTVRELLLSALWKVPDRSQDVLRVASVAGGRVGHDLLASVTGVEERELERALRPAVDRQLLVPDGDGYVFRHALIRAAIYENLLPGERSRLHSRFATALLDDPSLLSGDRLPAEVATHWYAAGDRERALESAWQAAEWARSSFAYDEQRQLLERVLELWTQVPDAHALPVDHADVLIAAAQACLLGGHPERGVELASAALDELDRTAEPVRAADALRLRAYLTYRISAGGTDDAIAGLSLTSAETAPSIRGQLLVLLASSRLMNADHRAALDYAEQAMRIAEPLGDRSLLARAQVYASWALADDGDMDGALALLASAKQTVREIRDYECLLTALVCEAGMHVDGNYERAVVAGREGIELARRVGMGSMRGTAIALNMVFALIELARLDEASQVITDALELDPPTFNRYLLLVNRMDVLLAVGRLDAAAEVLDELATIEQSTQVIPALTMMTAARRCRLLLLQGDLAGADRALAAALSTDVTAAVPDAVWHLLVIGAQIQSGLQALAGRDESARAIARARRDELVAAEEKVQPTMLWQYACQATYRAWLGPATESASGLASEPASGPASGSASGPAVDRSAERSESSGPSGAVPETPSSVALWQEAMTRWRSLNTPLRLAEALLGGAEAASSSGSKSDAVAWLREANAIATAVDAEPLRREIEQLATRARISLDPATESVRAPALDNEFGLTSRELEVLRLLTEGSSNRQIAGTLYISVNTAGAHVSHILTKLGVSTRTEAAAIAHRLNMFE